MDPPALDFTEVADKISREILAENEEFRILSHCRPLIRPYKFRMMPEELLKDLVMEEVS